MAKNLNRKSVEECNENLHVFPKSLIEIGKWPEM